MMKRLFIAIPVAEEIKKRLKPLLRELREMGADLKLVSVENIHFTLKFLGDVDEENIPEMIQKLTAISFKPFTISLQGVGVFPSAERINVLWVGMNSPKLISLMKKINFTLNYIRQEEREEVPHLTIARVKSGKNKEKLQQLVEIYKNTFFGEMMVEKIVLYESELGKEGPKYRVVKEFELR